MIKIKSRQVQRYQSKAEWNADTEYLLAGELGAESDTGRVKVGMGNVPWGMLPYTYGATDAQPTSGSDKLVTSDGIYNYIQGQKEVFYLTKGTTTWSEFQAALNAHKVIVCQAGGLGDFFYYTHIQSGEEAHFVAYNPDSKRLSSFILYDNNTYSDIAYIPIGPELFLVTYNSTSWSSIYNAYDSGKVLYCKYNGYTYYLSYYSQTYKTAIFSAVCLQSTGSGQLMSIICTYSNNTTNYSTNAQSVESSFNKTNVINSSSTIAQYPSAYAVYNFVNDKTAIVIGTLGADDMVLSQTISQIYAKYTAGANVIIRFDAEYKGKHFWTDLAISTFEYNSTTNKYALCASSIRPGPYAYGEATLFGFYQDNLSANDNRIVDPNVNGFNLGIIQIY